MSSFILFPSYTEHMAMAQNPIANLERRCVIFLGRCLPLVWGSEEELSWSEMSSSEISIRKREIKASRTKLLHPRGHSDVKPTHPVYMAIVRDAACWQLPSCVPTAESAGQQPLLPHEACLPLVHSWKSLLGKQIYPTAEETLPFTHEHDSQPETRYLRKTSSTKGRTKIF